MRFGTKLILLIIAVLAGWLVFSKAFESLKEKYFYKFVANRFHVYAEKNWGADLYIGYAEGGILKDLSLRNISVDRIKNLPDGFQIKADSLDLTYPAFGLLFGNVDGKFENLRIIYKDIIIPVDAFKREGLTVIIIKRSSINLSKFSDALPSGVLLSGVMNGECEIVLKKLKPHLVNISIDSKDFQFDRKPFRKAKAILKITAAGRAANPQISGDIKISRMGIDGGLSNLALLKALKFENDFLSGSSIDIDIKGENIVAANKYINANLSASLKLKKESGVKPYLIGDAVIKSGTFKLYENQFRIISGTVSFASPDTSPTFDIIERTNIGGYEISARIEGGEHIRFTPSSRPELPYSDITSLLLFGKQVKDLTGPEKDRLTRTDFNDTLASSLFSY